MCSDKIPNSRSKIHSFWSCKNHSPFFISENLSNLFENEMVVSMVRSPKRRSFLEEFTLMGISFAGIKFCGFLGF